MPKALNLSHYLFRLDWMALPWTAVRHVVSHPLHSIPLFELIWDTEALEESFQFQTWSRCRSSRTWQRDKRLQLHLTGISQDERGVIRSLCIALCEMWMYQMCWHLHIARSVHSKMCICWIWFPIGKDVYVGVQISFSLSTIRTFHTCWLINWYEKFILDLEDNSRKIISC